MKLNRINLVFIVVIILLVSVSQVGNIYAQTITEYPGYNRYWVFGNSNPHGFDWGTNYQNTSPIVFNNSSYNLNMPNALFYEGTATISTKQGQLVAVSNGNNFFNNKF